MRCPYCHADKDKVIDSRATEGGRAIRRRRACLNCDKRFTTFEHVEEVTRLNVVKRDGSRVPYSREKVMGGIQKACYKRPVPADTLTRAVDSIEERLFRQGVREVPSTEIGRLIIERLRRIDLVAYLRFASVYLKIERIDDLIEEMLEVRESTPEPPPREQGELF